MCVCAHTLCVCTVALKESRRLSHSVCPVTSAVLTTAGHPGSVQPAVRWPDIHAYWPCQDSPTFPRTAEASSLQTGLCFFFFFIHFPSERQSIVSACSHVQARTPRSCVESHQRVFLVCREPRPRSLGRWRSSLMVGMIP